MSETDDFKGNGRIDIWEMHRDAGVLTHYVSAFLKGVERSTASWRTVEPDLHHDTDNCSVTRRIG